MNIRTARAEDAPALLQIYAPYVTDTAVSFEYTVPKVAAFRDRITQTLQRYPYLVAEENGEILGYAYTSAFHPRIAYQWAAETSIYLRQDCRRRGLGRIFYDALEKISLQQGITKLYACIAYPPQPDPHLSLDSVQFHTRLGFEICGRFHQCGYKFDTWYDMVWMEKTIAALRTPMLPLIPFPELQ